MFRSTWFLVHTKPFSFIITYWSLESNLPQFIFHIRYYGYFVLTLKCITKPLLITILFIVFSVQIITVFFLQGLWWKYFVVHFFHDEFHVGVRQRIPKLIFHTISIYNQVLIWCIKGFQSFRIFVRSTTHHKPFYSQLTAVNEVREHIFFILDNIFVFIYQGLLLLFISTSTICGLRYCGVWIIPSLPRYG